VPFKNIRSAPGATIPLSITAPLSGGAAVPAVFVLGAPRGARIADGSHEVVTVQEDETVDTTGWDLAKLAMELPLDVNGHFVLSAFAISPSDQDPRGTTSQSMLNIVLDVQSAPVPIKTVGEDFVSKSTDATSMMAGNTGSGSSSASRGATQDRGSKRLDQRPEQPVSGAFAGGPSALPETPRGELRASVVGQIKDKDTAPRTAPAAPQIPEAGLRHASAVHSPEVGAGSELKATSLVHRAERLIQLGDISGARLVLERAAERGASRALFFLAQTFDPRLLRAWNVRGMRGDPDRARELYARAEQRGIPVAKTLAEAVR
jgi:hypothetical protein